VLGSPPERRSYHVVRYRWPVGHDAAVRSAYAEHRADLDGLGADGGLWLIGTLPEADGFVDAIAVFRSERGREGVQRPRPPVRARHRRGWSRRGVGSACLRRVSPPLLRCGLMPR
jgi:hypothetical protein